MKAPTRPWFLAGVSLALASLLWLLFTAGLTILRYRMNYASAYDFGLFSQMYYYMGKCLLPLTTCERDGLLSHFAVHLSPIFYLLLPLYKLFPRPETLLAAQALLVASGLIPLCLLGRKLRLGPGATFLFGLIYCAYPAFMGGCFYDFHENAFLAPLILWTLYWMECRRFKIMCIFALFILLVKEDAPVYAACIGLYLFLGKRNYPYGAGIFLASCIYFCAAIWYLSHFGDGAMINRFDNYISDESLGLLGMFKTILVNPLYVAAQMLTQDKLIFFLQMLLPLGFLPLLTLRWQRWVLLIPFNRYTYDEQLQISALHPFPIHLRLRPPAVLPGYGEFAGFQAASFKELPPPVFRQRPSLRRRPDSYRRFFQNQIPGLLQKICPQGPGGPGAFGPDSDRRRCARLHLLHSPAVHAG